MKKFLSVNTLLSQANQAIGRFPLPMLLTTLGTILAFSLIELANNNINGDPPLLVSTLSKGLMTVAFGFPLVLSLALAGERGGWPNRTKGIANLAAILLMGAYYEWVIPGGEAWRWNGSAVATILILNASAILTLTFAPFLRSRENQGFWQYNRHTLTQLFLTGAVTGTLILGVNLILFTIQELFNVKVSSTLFQHVDTVIVGVIAPLVLLSGIPSRLSDLEKEKTVPSVVKAFGQYVLVPLLAIYTLILYIYAGQILITTEWPKGVIGGLIIGYASVGILSTMILHPFQNHESSGWIATYSKWFYRLLVPLIIMLFIAVGIRIGNYGITEIRYYGILLGLWLVGIALYNMVAKKTDIKWIPLSVSVLLLFSIWGPWSSFSLSQYSQTTRLSALMTQYGLLENGKIIKKVSEVGEITQGDKKDMRSIVNYLGDRHSFAPIEGWFKDEIPGYANLEQWERSQSVMTLLGLETGYPEDLSRYFNLIRENTELISIEGYDQFMEIWAGRDINREKTLFTLKSGKDIVKITQKNQALQLKKNNESPIQIDIESMLKKISDEEMAQGLIAANKLSLRAENDTTKILILFNTIDFQIEGDKHIIQNYTASVFMGNK